MQGVKLQQLRFFLAVYEERSITAAARRLNATQSGVSVQIRDLEDMLGLTLFQRVSAGVVPTKSGELIFHRATNILREVSRLQEDVSAQTDALSGEVRAGIMPTFARSILAPVLSRFMTAHPYVDVKVTEAYSGTLSESVSAGELDFAIVPSGSVPAGLRATYLDSDLELLTSATPIEGAAGGVDLSTIPPLRLALPGRKNSRRAKIEEHLRSFSRSDHTILELDSMMTTLDIVRRGDWSAILPGCLCLPDLEDPKLNFYPIVQPKMTVDYLLIEPAATEGSPAVQRFAQELGKEIRSSCARCRAFFDV
jgi:DNA-binding transcriptional LysR family regulator